MGAVAEFYSQENKSGRITDDYLSHRYDNLDRLAGFVGKRVLDIGCGQGMLATYCAQHYGAAQVVGIDPYEGVGERPENEATFNKCIESLGLDNVEVRRLDAYDIDKLGQTFDVVTFDAVLHHIFWVDKKTGLPSMQGRIDDLFEKVHNVLSDSGVVVVRENAAFNLPLVIYRDWLRRPCIDFRTKHHWRAWADVISPAGFTLERKAVYWPYKLRGFAFVQYDPLLYVVPGAVDLLFTKRPTA